MDHKHKKQKLDDDEAVDANLVVAIEKLQQVQDELERVAEEASDKVLEVEQHYNEVRHPIYAKRNEVIEGIPDFWLTAFLSHPFLFDCLTEIDQKILKHLHALHVEDFKDVKSGYSIHFLFRQNPYFSNDKLTKEYRFSEDGTVSVTATKPDWKPGMDVTKVGARPGKGAKRGAEEGRSFFRWFQAEEKDEESLTFDDQIADNIKDDLWPNPLRYFSLEAEEETDEEVTWVLPHSDPGRHECACSQRLPSFGP